MTRGLVRKNNLRDLTNAEQARTNLGLQNDDYKRIKGLFLSSGVSNLDVQKIANSSTNFQSQVNASTALLGTITPALYADKVGDTLSGTWTNSGKIGASGIVVSGITRSGSTDALFLRSSPLSSLQIETASGVVLSSGLVVNNLTSSGNVVIASGKVVNRTMVIGIRGVPYKIDLA
jgi:hypothetical protein